MLDFLKTFAHLEGTMVFRLRENIQGNVFNQPYQYMMIRSIIPEDTLPSNLKNDGDPMSDFFCTLRKVQTRSSQLEARRRAMHASNSNGSRGEVGGGAGAATLVLKPADDPDMRRRAIILAFKVRKQYKHSQGKVRNIEVETH